MENLTRSALPAWLDKKAIVASGRRVESVVVANNESTFAEILPPIQRETRDFAGWSKSLQ
jgi:hypothetical protein